MAASKSVSITFLESPKYFERKYEVCTEYRSIPLLLAKALTSVFLPHPPGPYMRKALSGMLAPTIKENLLGYAQVREVFSVSKVGKVAGCMVTEGMVKRGSKVRLLRDDVVIHEGDLSQLKRFKDDAKEVKEGMECGMSFANYDDIKEGDMIECFDIEEVAREL